MFHEDSGACHQQWMYFTRAPSIHSCEIGLARKFESSSSRLGKEKQQERRPEVEL